MLLGPECFEKVGDPAVDGSQPVEPGVAGAAGVVVALEDPFPLASEAGPRPASAVVAGLAQPAAVEIGGAAGTAERELLLMVRGHRASSGFSQAPSGAARVWDNPGTPLLSQLSFECKNHL